MKKMFGRDLDEIDVRFLNVTLLSDLHFLHPWFNRPAHQWNMSLLWQKRALMSVVQRRKIVNCFLLHNGPTNHNTLMWNFHKRLPFCMSYNSQSLAFLYLQIIFNEQLFPIVAFCGMWYTGKLDILYSFGKYLHSCNF